MPVVQSFGRGRTSVASEVSEFANFEKALKEIYNLKDIEMAHLKGTLVAAWGEQVASAICSSPLCDGPLKVSMLVDFCVPPNEPSLNLLRRYLERP